MSQLINNEQKLNDIIFAGRNQEYGAYAIRSSYGNTVFRSVSFMLIGVGSCLSIAFYLSNKNQHEPDLSGQVFIHDSVFVIPFNNEEKKKEERMEENHERPSSDTKTKTDERYTGTVIDSTFESVETATAMASTLTNSVTNGDDSGSLATKGSSVSEGPGGGGRSDTTVSREFEVDSACVFPGGLSALYKFISSNLKYPYIASSEGKEGTVYVKFVVDEKCKVGQLSLLNSVGYGMDEEALRVVSLIPRFKSPAKVKGHAVKVYYQMPIRFRYKY